jgi:hypothetical protein
MVLEGGGASATAGAVVAFAVCLMAKEALVLVALNKTGPEHDIPIAEMNTPKRVAILVNLGMAFISAVFESPLRIMPNSNRDFN